MYHEARKKKIQIKAGIAHCLIKRTFLSIQGANNLSGLEEVFRQLHETGTQLIVEALDTDKFSNPDVAKGAQKIYLLAKQCGMQCRSLTWNPNYILALARENLQGTQIEEIAITCVDGKKILPDVWYGVDWKARSASL